MLVQHSVQHCWPVGPQGVSGSQSLVSTELLQLQEDAAKMKILKEVEKLLVSKLDADKQAGTDAPCRAVKQFLHETPYEQVCFPSRNAS